MIFNGFLFVGICHKKWEDKNINDEKCKTKGLKNDSIIEKDF